jgi:hypothetical protein
MQAQVQKLVSVVKMTTVLEEYATTKEQYPVVHFFFVGKRNKCKEYS